MWWFLMTDGVAHLCVYSLYLPWWKVWMGLSFASWPPTSFICLIIALKGSCYCCFCWFLWGVHACVWVYLSQRTISRSWGLTAGCQTGWTGSLQTPCEFQNDRATLLKRSTWIDIDLEFWRVECCDAEPWCLHCLPRLYFLSCVCKFSVLRFYK